MNKKTHWKKEPQCEVCGQEPATSFSWLDRDWKFCGDCTTDTESYYIELKLFFQSPASTVDWIAHMAEKNWMDWGKFADMMGRFRAATDSFGVTNA